MEYNTHAVEGNTALSYKGQHGAVYHVGGSHEGPVHKGPGGAIRARPQGPREAHKGGPGEAHQGPGGARTSPAHRGPAHKGLAHTL